MPHIQENPIVAAKTARLELYRELLEECDEAPQILGRRLLDLSDMKEWLALKMFAELLGGRA